MKKTDINFKENSFEEPIKESLWEMLTEERKVRIENTLKNRTTSTTIVLDRVFHEHNISAVIRSADAFGISNIHLLSPNFSSQRGISLGAEKWVNIKLHSDTQSMIAELKNENFKLVGLVPPNPENQLEGTNKVDNIPISSLPFEEKLALVFGSEGEGISEELINACEIKAHIPQYGFVESLNVSVACAITLYTSRLHVDSIAKRVKDLEEDTYKEMQWDWTKKSTTNAELVISELEKRNTEKDAK